MRCQEDIGNHLLFSAFYFFKSGSPAKPGAGHFGQQAPGMCLFVPLMLQFQAQVAMPSI